MNKLSVLLAASALFAAGTVHASVTAYNSQAAFSGLGTITQNTNFDAYSYPGWSFPGSPFTIGDMTFIEGGQNLIGGSVYGFARNLLTDNFFLGTTANISGNHDLFAFNAGNFLGTGSATFDITTNLGGYQYVETVPDGSAGFQFFGYKASAGEYFTGFHVSGGNATGFTDVQLGNVAAVPEPETYTMLLAGLGLLCFMELRKKQNLS